MESGKCKAHRFVIARRPKADVAISGRQLRFRQKYPVIRPGSARFPRRFAPRNDTSGWCGGAPVPSCGLISLYKALAPRKGDAASVRRQSRQRLRSERRYRLPEVIAFSIGADRNEVRAGRTVIKFRQAMKAILRLTHTLSQHRSTISSIMPCRRWHSSRNCSTMSACMP